MYRGCLVVIKQSHTTEQQTAFGRRTGLLVCLSADGRGRAAPTGRGRGGARGGWPHARARSALGSPDGLDGVATGAEGLVRLSPALSKRGARRVSDPEGRTIRQAHGLVLGHAASSSIK